MTVALFLFLALFCYAVGRIHEICREGGTLDLLDALSEARDERDQARVGQVAAWGEVAEVNRDLALTQNELRAHRLSLVQMDGTRRGYVRALQRSGGAS